MVLDVEKILKFVPVGFLSENRGFCGGGPGRNGGTKGVPGRGRGTGGSGEKTGFAIFSNLITESVSAHKSARSLDSIAPSSMSGLKQCY